MVKFVCTSLTLFYTLRNLSTSISSHSEIKKNKKAMQISANSDTGVAVTVCLAGVMQVTVSEGILEGELVKNELAEFVSFKGIPFAAPPVGDLRFKAPKPPAAWSGIRSAKKFGFESYQFDPLMGPGQPVGSEDCLYLNVYTPSLKPATPTPVMVFIHGGAFLWGSGNDDLYGPEFLVRKGVILVTINYRLEALGFLSLETEDIPGNAGMKDQVAALRWIKKNIVNFGGDPENITIFGESAGGASVSFHLVSPVSKGLFKRAICMSGCLNNSWAHGFEAREKALKLAKKLGCDSEDDKELYKFFKKVPKEKLVSLDLPVVKYDGLVGMAFGVVNERKYGDNEIFFNENEFNIFKNGIHDDVEVMTGYTSDEGIIALAQGLSIQHLLTEATDFKQFFTPTSIRRNSNIRTQLEVGRKLSKFYLEKPVATHKDLEKIFKFLSMDSFVYGTILFGQYLSRKSKVYLYKMSCHSERNIMSDFYKIRHLLGGRKVTCHADDLFYLFPVKLAQLKVEKNSQAEKLIDQVTALWTNFAKFGNPTPDSTLSVQWTPFTVDNQHYLDIGNQLKLKQDPEKEDMTIWDEVMKNYMPNSTFKI